MYILSDIFVRAKQSEYYTDIIYEAAPKKPMLKPVPKTASKLVRIFIMFTLPLFMPPAFVQAASQNYALEHTRSHKPILLARASGLTLDQAVNQVRKQTGGRILSAKTVSKKGQRTHRIKVLMPSGRVKIIHKPAG